MTSQPQSPLDAYESALASGKLRPQVAQRRAVEALEDLYRELSLPPAIQKRRREAAARARRHGTTAKGAQQPTRRSGLLGWFAALFRGGSGSASGADAEAGAATSETSFARSLYLFGPVGRGKTTAMDLFYEALGPKRAQRRHFHEFMSELHADIHARREKGDARGDTAARFARAQAKRAKVLCFDEFFVNNIADATLLGRVLTVLIDEGVTVVTTSNQPPAELYPGGLKRELFLPTIALIVDEFDVVNLDHGQDYRLTGVADTEAWLQPLDDRSARLFRGLFEREAGAREGQPLQLSLLGRSLEVPEAVGRTALFRFADLCEAPLGRDDFQLLAQSFDRVFIDEIPVIRYATRESGERFRVMIDVLYEAGTCVYGRAEAPIGELIRLEEHEMPPFLRTESRLVEMQSLAYRQPLSAQPGPEPKGKTRAKPRKSANSGPKQA